MYDDNSEIQKDLDYLESEISRVEQYAVDNMSDIADLLRILLADDGISDEMKSKIKARFFTIKTKKNGKEK